MRRSCCNACLCAALLAGAGCSGPEYTPPEARIAGSYPDAGPAKGAAIREGRIVPVAEAPERWWALFEDPELNALVDRAVRGNRNIQGAISRIRQARAERAEIAASFFPELDAAGGYERGRGSENVVLPLGAIGGGGSAGVGSPGSVGSAVNTSATQPAARQVAPSGGASAGGGAQVPPGGPQSPFGEGGLPGVTTSLYQVGFDATWEIDVFGTTRHAVEAANASLEAANDDAQSVVVSLLGEVASDYMQLRASQVRLGIARRNVASQRETLGVLRDRAASGLATEVDVAQQAALVASSEATLPELEASEQATIHALAYLVGGDPNDLDKELGAPGSLPDMPPTVPVGVPSDLLRRRPDVRSAERKLAAATAEVGVAHGQLFPQFSLTGTLGLDSSQSKNLVARASQYYSISPGISWPILDWGRIRASIRVQGELEKQAFIAYQDAVAQALRDVEDALVRYNGERERLISLRRAVEESRVASDSARASLAQGLVDERVTLEADRATLQSEDAAAQCQAALRTDLISLYKALGGGWNS
ncbi:MAG TPA: efflux transporter outer membrane subunit [Opitutaceae bacterium]|jgi:NodT family efflux transporter outer membrane factor (OMF) lipoprotein